MNRDQALLLLKEALLPDLASMSLSRSGEPTKFQSITIDLSSTTFGGQVVSRNNPYEFNIPFKAFLVTDATDTNANVNMLVGSRESNVESIPVSLAKVKEMQLNFKTDKFYLYWTAQTGKSITILFAIDAEISSGVQSQENVISEGSSFVQATAVSVLATATQILASDNDRAVTTICNNGSETVYIGDSSVTIADGLPLQPNAYKEVRNKGTVYGIVAGVSSEVRILNEK